MARVFQEQGATGVFKPIQMKYFKRGRTYKFVFGKQSDRIKFIAEIRLFRSCVHSIPVQPISFYSKTPGVFLAPQVANTEII